MKTRCFYIRFFCPLLIAGSLTLAVSSCGKSDRTAGSVAAEACRLGFNADWEKALTLAEEAADMPGGDDADVTVVLALALEHNAREAEALAKLQKISDETGNFAVQYNLGRLLFRKGKYDQSLKHLVLAHNLRPDDSNSLLLLARANMKLRTNDTIKYYRMLRKMPRYKNDPMILNELGTAMFLRRQMGDSAIAFRKAYELDKENPVYLLNNAVVNDFYLKQRRNAIGYYEKFLVCSASREDLASERAEAEARLKDLKKELK